MPLYLVSSPIGNLADLSRRAVDTLAHCDVIACEDTRRTQNLLNHLGLKASLLSYYDAVEKQRLPSLLARLAQGQDIAVISDAGTPCLSDPGYPLVRAAIEAGIRVVPIPGPSAIITALSASGLPTDRFCFEGYVPRTDSKRRLALQAIGHETATIVFFEVPTRLVATLEMLAALYPDREVALACELTKVYENFVRGTASQVLDQVRQKDRILGEFTLVVAGASQPADPGREQIESYVEAMRQEDLSPRTIKNLVSRLLGVSKKAVFEVIERS